MVTDQAKIERTVVETLGQLIQEPKYFEGRGSVSLAAVSLEKSTIAMLIAVLELKHCIDLELNIGQFERDFNTTRDVAVWICEKISNMERE